MSEARRNLASVTEAKRNSASNLKDARSNSLSQSTSRTGTSSTTGRPLARGSNDLKGTRPPPPPPYSRTLSSKDEDRHLPGVSDRSKQASRSSVSGSVVRTTGSRDEPDVDGLVTGKYTGTTTEVKQNKVSSRVWFDMGGGGGGGGLILHCRVVYTLYMYLLHTHTLTQRT